MESTLGLRAGQPNSSPLEGSEPFRTQQAESGLRQLARREWWLWFSAFFVATLSALAFVLSSFPSFFRHSEHFYEIRSDQARWGILCLLLLFNGWMLYRQWSFRRQRKQLSGQNAGADAQSGQISDSSGIDPVTGLHTRAFIEQQLGKEIARARRQNTALSLATVHLDEFAEINNRYGPSAIDAALKELARRLKKACRGSDFAARLANDDFLLVLPECNLGEVKSVLNRLGALEMVCSGRKMNLVYTTGWVDYQPGDLPADLLKRAAQLLHLYENAAKDSLSSTLAPH
ncbi:MAG TPA: GGDEF domain-containing protein [Candidatus Acidoferrum sp.]|nr:GGDEF domain-containing protein [Candidatus Acidoferrum sp.]